jgi:glycosyltransferase involved in cell wall biosynthesis
MARASRTTSPRKVAILGTRGYPSFYGGFETAIRHLAPDLADLGWDVTVYGRDKAVADAQAGAADPRIHRRYTPGIESKSLSTLSYGLTSALSAMWHKPDVALIMNVANGFWIPLLRMRGIPTLVNVDGIEWERAKWGRAAKAMFKAGAWFVAKFANELVFDAHAIGARWKKDYGRDGVFIPYGGEPSELLPVTDGLEHRSFVLVVARFVPENSIVEFVEAASELSKKWPVVIVGSSGYGGELDERVQALADRSKNVQWLGHVSDDKRLHSLWQHCGVYFHGHSVGGTNPALVQAMALGAPTVARDTIYNREVLGPQGKFFAPDPSEIVRVIDDVMTSDANKEELSQTALRRAADVYTWRKVNDSYAAALERLADR